MITDMKEMNGDVIFTMRLNKEGLIQDVLNTMAEMEDWHIFDPEDLYEFATSSKEFERAERIVAERIVSDEEKLNGFIVSTLYNTGDIPDHDYINFVKWEISDVLAEMKENERELR